MTTSPLRPSNGAVLSERRAVAIVGAVQFVNVLDFMMVMPLGPDFARELAIPTSHIGWIGGSYTAAASVAGMAGALFLDRFDRRNALCVALVGLALGTAAGGFAIDLTTLMSARVLAGAFGGPATSLAIAVIADTVAPERRGVAMSRAMGAFAVASVFGVPFGLKLAEVATFRAPFFAVAIFGLAITAAAFALLPPLTAHLDRPRANIGSGSFFAPEIALSLASSALVMTGNFALIPNFSAYLQFNLGYPRDELHLVYLCGGAAAFVAMQFVGRAVDRVGSARALAVGTALYVTTLVCCFVRPVFAFPPLLAFVSFMVTNSLRFVPLQALATRVPTPDRRARFLSAQSAVQHLASSVGAIGAASYLGALPSGRLVGFERVVIVSVAFACVVPFFTFGVERLVRAREAHERTT